MAVKRVGLAITVYIIYGAIYIYTVTSGMYGREITKYMVIYGAYIRFWPTLHMI